MATPSGSGPAAKALVTKITDFWPDPYEPPPGREHLTERW
jgi:hypothetical protein